MKSPKEVLEVYENSCKQHKTIELDIIKNQIAVSFYQDAIAV